MPLSARLCAPLRCRTHNHPLNPPTTTIIHIHHGKHLSPPNNTCQKGKRTECSTNTAGAQPGTPRPRIACTLLPQPCTLERSPAKTPHVAPKPPTLHVPRRTLHNSKHAAPCSHRGGVPFICPNALPNLADACRRATSTLPRFPLPQAHGHPTPPCCQQPVIRQLRAPTPSCIEMTCTAYNPATPGPSGAAVRTTQHKQATCKREHARSGPARAGEQPTQPASYVSSIPRRTRISDSDHSRRLAALLPCLATLRLLLLYALDCTRLILPTSRTASATQANCASARQGPRPECTRSARTMLSPPQPMRPVQATRVCCRAGNPLPN